ncbi:hypothetical protein [Mobilicoccus sp.]|nr:hypothetical protein [Mobilicoccus sp.]
MVIDTLERRDDLIHLGCAVPRTTITRFGGVPGTPDYHQTALSDP